MLCSRGIFLLGGGNLVRNDFDHLENCYVVGGNEPFVGREQKFVGGGGDFCW